MINKIKILICFCSVLFCSSCTSSNSVLKDSRDGQVYEVKEMKDGNIWMTQNLNYISSGSWCFREDNTNCDKFGRLYTYEAAKNACPDGWHLPTDDEWWELTSLYGKAYSTYFGEHHNEDFQRDKKNNNPDDGKDALNHLQIGGDSGLDLTFSGYRLEDGTYYTDDNVGNFWTSSEYKTTGTGWYYHIRKGGDIRRNFARDKALAFSCRCIKNDD